MPVQITPHNTSPGGLRQQVQDVRGTERYQAYALGGLNARAYSEDSDLNGTDARLEGLFRYNFRGGLSLQALMPARPQQPTKTRAFIDFLLKHFANHPVATLTDPDRLPRAEG